VSKALVKSNGKANGKPHGSNGHVAEWSADCSTPERQTLASLIILGRGFEYPELAALQPRHFFYPENRQLFAVLQEMAADGKPLDATVLAYRLEETGAFPNYAAADAFLLNVIKAEATGAGLRKYAEKVAEAYGRRRDLQLAETIREWSQDGLPLADIRGLIESHLDGITGERRGERFKKLSAADLDAITDAVPYIVPNVLADGQPCLCVGGSKMLKTTVLIDLVLSSCWDGSHFLGYFPVTKQCRAWFISGESGDRTIAETARRIAVAAGRELRDTRDFFYSPTLPRLNDPADVAELGRAIAGDGINLLVLDPAYLMLDVGGREGSLFAVGPLLARVTEACAKHGCTLIVVHHSTQARAKTGNYTPPALSDASWAGFEQFARQWILLGRREAYQDGTGQHRLWLSTGGSAGHGGLYHLDVDEGTRATPGGRFWETTVTPAAQATTNEAERREAAQAERDQARKQEHADKILAAMRHRPAGDTMRALKEVTGLNSTNFSAALALLIEAAKVEPCEVKKNHTTHDGYRIPNPQKDLYRDTVGHSGAIPS
jgi:hypothetical protein